MRDERSVDFGSHLFRFRSRVIRINRLEGRSAAVPRESKRLA